MNVIEYLREEVRWAHYLLQTMMEDVTPEQAHWTPTGIANPLGAIYAHAVFSEDAVVTRLFKGRAPLFESDWADRHGASTAQWGATLDWARGVRVDLPEFRQYAQTVQANTEAYLASLTEADLDRQLDLTNQGLGQRTLGWALAALLISHLNNMIGEISCLKGIQGLRGYPF